MTVEGYLRGIVTGLVLFVAGSGLVTLGWTIPPPFVQVLQLAHYQAGLVLALAGVLYMVVHLRSTVGALSTAARTLPRLPAYAALAVVLYTIGLIVANPSRETRAIANPVLGVGSVITLTLILISVIRVLRKSGTRTTVVGAVALLTCVAAVIAGLFLAWGFILYTGLNSPRAAHILFAPIALGLVVWHIRSSRRSAANKSRIYEWNAPFSRVALPVLLVCVAVTTIAGTGMLMRAVPSEVDARLLAPVDVDFAHRYQATCQTCHPEPVAGWSSSSHRHAANNPVFTGLVQKLAADRGGEAVRNCLHCHAPHAPDPATTPFTEVLASDGYNNGVHCVSCHRTTPGPGHGDGSFAALPLAHDQNWFITDRLPPPPETAETFLNSLILSRINLHRATFTAKPQGSRVCLPCHVQTLSFQTEGRLTHAIQDQYDSWAASSFGNSGRECASCHMQRYISHGSYLVVDHRMRAASTYVTAIGAGEQGLNEVLTALQGGSSLPPPTFEDPPRPEPGPLLSLRLERKRVDDRDVLVAKTEGTGRIGHSFPNGPTDLIQVWLAVHVTDPTGRVLLDVGRDGPEGAPRLGHTFEDAQGQAIHDHRLWAIDRVIDHGRIPPDGTHELIVPLPTAPQGPVRVEAAWRYRRFDPALARSFGDQRTWMLPIVDIATFKAESL